MSDLDYLNLSTDLRRVSVWLQEGRIGVAEPFINKLVKQFGNDGLVVGKKTISAWLQRIAVHESGWRSSEDALTLSIMLKNKFSSN